MCPLQHFEAKFYTSLFAQSNIWFIGEPTQPNIGASTASSTKVDIRSALGILTDAYLCERKPAYGGASCIQSQLEASTSIWDLDIISSDVYFIRHVCLINNQCSNIQCSLLVLHRWKVSHAPQLFDSNISKRSGSTRPFALLVSELHLP